jgi:2-polyprenyl-3-methyl-5-hydroxy-6-metoxy-1,4-benzoquinol methylase
MKNEQYAEIMDKLESIKNSLPYLEKAVKSKKKSDIDNSISYFIYRVFKLYKEVTGKGSSESIVELTNKLWWFKKEKDKKKPRKFLDVNKLYSEWASFYDEEVNLVIFLEEKDVKDFFPNVKGKEVLDYGCGTGRYAIPLTKKGANVTAIDFNQAMLNKAKKKAKKNKVKVDFIKQDITKYIPKNKFDLIISMLVLDHIENLEDIVKVINKASRIGTEVVISNVHPEIIRQSIDLRTGKGQGYLVEKRKTNQFYHSLEEYVEVFKKEGFVLTKVRDVVYQQKYWNIKRLKKFGGLKNKAVGILMKFEKMK